MSDLISRNAVLKVLNTSRSIRARDGAGGVWIDLLDVTDGILQIGRASCRERV